MNTKKGTNVLRVCLAQINPTVGALEANADKIITSIKKAQRAGVDIVVFPEMSLSGYPPEDLLHKPHFITENKKQLARIIEATPSLLSIVGFPYREGKHLFNAAALIYKRKLKGVYKKVFLPNYGVFDEKRYFYPGDSSYVLSFNDEINVGVTICEDIWHKEGPQRTEVIAGKADVIINISASPYHAKKLLLREKMLSSRARENSAAVLYCNVVGGQDELIFDGGSLAFSHNGQVLARAQQFQEENLFVDVAFNERRIPRQHGKKATPPIKVIALPALQKKSPLRSINAIEKKLPMLDEVYAALVLGIRDYVCKNHFTKVVVGLSGGIDSALTAVLAVDALGKENVISLIMPSDFSSSATMRDAQRLAQNIGIPALRVKIDTVYQAYLALLKSHFKATKHDSAEENLQARIRGNVLMAFSNKFNWLVLTTGNKSEVSTGYCTLYGDMAGGFAVLKDVPKMLVYALARQRNAHAHKALIPRSIIQRAPSAELRKNQKDTDSLPPYPVLDKILDLYIEKDKSYDEIVKKHFSHAVVDNVIAMVDRNEYKRRQAPPGIKITPKSFGKDRRMPITNQFVSCRRGKYKR